MLRFSSDSEEEEEERLWTSLEDFPKTFEPLEVKIVTPFTLQLKKVSPFHPQENFGDWPHKVSALSLGEASVVKYAETFPLRTGLEFEGDGEERRKDAEERIIYLPADDGDGEEGGSGVVEEICMTSGVCVVSEGPLGGPSRVKGIYRPIESYGTGANVKHVVKTKFHKDMQDNCDDKDTYYCLLENAGISLYAEGKSECHVAYMAEFQIERILSCPFGLLVVPVYQQEDEEGNNDSKHLYVLTHPSKQVSRVWIKTIGNDFMEFDGTTEKLVMCEDSLCIFWDSEKNSGFTIKRLVRLEKQDITDSTALNASIYYTNDNTDSCSSPFTPAGGSAMYSPIARSSSAQKESPFRVSRENSASFKDSNTMTYWPNFSFDTSTNSNFGFVLSTGFYPPHFCVYDDAEFYVRPLFSCLDSIEANSEPEKYQVVSRRDGFCDVLSLWFLIENTLHSYCVNVQHGKQLSFYEVDDVLDFVCSEASHGMMKLAILTTEREINIGFLDNTSRIILSSTLVHSIPQPVSKLDAFLYGDSLLCSLEKSSKKGVLNFKDYRKFRLISGSVEKLSLKVSSGLLTKLVGLYILNGKKAKSSSEEWDIFVSVIKQMITYVRGYCKTMVKHLPKLEDAFQLLLEELTVTNARQDAEKIEDFRNRILRSASKSKCNLGYDTESVTSERCVFTKFLHLLCLEDPTGSPMFQNMPTIMKLLLNNPDELSNLSKLYKYSTGQSFAPVVDILIADVLRRNYDKVEFSWPANLLKTVGREDYVIPDTLELSPSEHYNPLTERDEMCEDCYWWCYVLDLHIFTEDRRLEDVCKLLDSACYIPLTIEQKPGISDHDFLEEQEKHVLQHIQVTLSLPVGRAAFTLRTEVKSFANLTNVINVPMICLVAKCPKKGTTIDLSESNPELTSSLWPTFHNAVAATLAVRFCDTPTDAWFAYNKAKATEGAEQAGMVLGFGLNGILKSMPATLQHEYMSKENSFMSMAMLLGLAVNHAGTCDRVTEKIITLHMGALLPACTSELEIPKLASLVAPCASGLLFIGTHNSHISKVLLCEISKRYSPLSNFGGGAHNTSSSAGGGDTGGTIADREAHSLCAGFGLGFVNLGKGRSASISLEDDGFDGILRRFVLGGPRPNIGDLDDDETSQTGPSLPSLWEEYRCCHIEEGDNVNVDVATPSAIVAVALTYLRSGNDAVLRWLSPPDTLHLLDGVRPDILMLRSLAYMLVLEEIPEDTTCEWLQEDLMPRVLVEKTITITNEYHRIGSETISVAWSSIICGYCLGLGIRRAGTRHRSTVTTIHTLVKLLLKQTFEDPSGNSFLPKNFLESILCSMMLALSLLKAGSGDIPILRLLRFMHNKITAMPVTASYNSYGLGMCISMATGFLFLGGGRYSLCNDDRSIAVILASVFPKWPINANDNRYHLQALRHLYVLACQPRLLLPKPMPHNRPLYFQIELTEEVQTVKAPCLLPPLNMIKSIVLDDKAYLPIEFVLPRDLPYLKKLIENNGIIKLVRRPIADIRFNYLKQMEYVETKVYHSTLPSVTDSIPVGESYKIMELNNLSRLAESSGLKNVLPAILALNDGDPTNPEWQVQVQILFTWVARSSTPSVIPHELLGIHFSKSDKRFSDFVSDAFLGQAMMK